MYALLTWLLGEIDNGIFSSKDGHPIGKGNWHCTRASIVQVRPHGRGDEDEQYRPRNACNRTQALLIQFTFENSLCAQMCRECVVIPRRIKNVRSSDKCEKNSWLWRTECDQNDLHSAGISLVNEMETSKWLKLISAAHKLGTAKDNEIRAGLAYSF